MAAEAAKSFISGGCGGVASVIVGQPMDMIKVQLQNQSVTNPMYNGTFDCAKKMIAKDGFRGLYRGVAAPLVGVSPIFALSFAGNNAGQQMVRSATGHQKLSYGECFCAGMIAGVYSTVIMAPGERIKCLLQTDTTGKYKGMGDCAKQLFREGGIKNVYKGTVLTLMRDVPASGCYFGIYEVLKDQLTPAGSTQMSLRAVLLAGGMAGMANWAVAIPPDTLKTRFQTDVTGQYKGVGDVYRSVMAEGGFKTMFRGFSAVMIRAFPANAACFLTMEWSLKGLNLVW